MSRSVKPDKKKAQSIVAGAERDMAFTLQLPISEDSAATIIRNIYESFRMLGDAMLVARGIKSEDHESQIRELISTEVKTQRPVGILRNLKTLRHNINYNGYLPTRADVDDAVDIARKLFKPLLIAVKKQIQ